jgi:hypothetical protein
MSQALNGNGHQPDPAAASSAAAAPGTHVSAPAAPAHGLLPSASASGATPAGASLRHGTLDALRRRRIELAERVAGLTWDLGGLTYEMAVRDHYRLDVLARRAAELQEADAQLGEVERLLAAAEAGVHGQCRSCGSVHSRGAAYCWHCGATLRSEARPSVLPDRAPEGAPGS